MANNHWEHFAHEADMGVRGFGMTKEEAFEQTALALTAVVTDPKTVTENEVVEITCEAPDDELLFVDWLNALVFEMATRHMLFGRFEVHIDGQRLKGKAWGEKVDVVRHQSLKEGCQAGATRLLKRIGWREENWIRNSKGNTIAA